MSTLPFDVLDITAEDVRNDIPTLKAACLVARHWQHAFQHVLFSDVLIKDERSTHHFSNAVNDISSLGIYVRSLEVRHVGPGSILSKLPRLERITIRNVHVLLPDFCDSLRLGLASHLTSLTLHDVSWFNLPIFNGATALKHFTSSRTSYCGEAAGALVEDGQIRSHVGQQLHSLSLLSLPARMWDGYQLLKWLTDPRCIMDLRGLKSLDIRTEHEAEWRRLCRFSSVIPSTLEHLTYKPPSQIAAPRLGTQSMQRLLDDFNLERFTHLRTLTLYTHLGVNEDYTEFSLLPWCFAFLSTIRTPSNLESLTMHCSFIRDKDNLVANPRQVSKRWDNFDRLFSSAAFSNLDQVALYLLVTHETPFFLVKNAIAGKLPRLDHDGKLLIVPSEDGLAS
ncbi:hypothetical protein BDN72DRAFT_839440 [Pluteus cervinus]|uniref:Uncharacterized protein n=1 Tax=Pluteus cervinus TaxID=181527 RepID=A0ACD3AX55_9AGAR|nr:hypothetical protein BDN72DRAFT_839440 [Pluteus cervinus]